VGDSGREPGAPVLRRDMPFADTSTASLAFLSTQQALADLAQFRDFYQGLFCAAHAPRLATGAHRARNPVGVTSGWSLGDRTQGP